MMYNLYSKVLILSLILIAAGSCNEPTEHSVVITNPYEDVDWSSWTRHTVNLHTHTTQSDGQMSPSEIIDAYKELGYAALAITDHNKYTWPWNTWGRDTLTDGLAAIPGCEPSRHDHVNSFFCDYDGASGNIEITLDSITNKGGLAQINHPGRYSRSVSWYKDLYTRYPALIAMEVYNQGDRYENDRELWDNLLSQTMPGRSVWATSCDDMHKSDHLGRNRQIVLSTETRLSLDGVRESLEKGRSFACYDLSGTGENLIIPDSIFVDADTIRVYVEDPDADIRWISMGEEVHTGVQLVLSEKDALGTYVRAEIRGPNGARLLTQPFGLEQSVSTGAQNGELFGTKARQNRAAHRHIQISPDQAHSSAAPAKDTRGRHVDQKPSPPGVFIRN